MAPWTGPGAFGPPASATLPGTSGKSRSRRMQVVNFAPAAGPHSALRHHRTRLASAACLLHPRYMLLNPVIRRLRTSGARPWAAALGALVVLLGSGLPCACRCLPHAIDPAPP